jgi:integrase
MTDYIITQGTRVLMPSEYGKLRDAMISPAQHALIARWQLEKAVAFAKGDADTVATLTRKINNAQRYPLVCDMLLLTGMRVVEACAMKPDWYRASRRVIAIPPGACKKVKCTYTERTVMLSLPGCDAVDRYLTSGVSIPEKVTSRDTLRRYAAKAGIGEDGVTTKMFRKTLASWLIACFPEQEMYISASMGHSREVLQRHYLGKGFPREELEKMRAYLKGWGTTV